MTITTGRDVCDDCDVSEQPEPLYLTILEDGVEYVVCPVDGKDCCRISGSWAEDAMAYHVQLHHVRWR